MLIEVPVPSHESDRLIYLSVRIPLLPLSTIFILEFGTVLFMPVLVERSTAYTYLYLAIV